MATNATVRNLHPRQNNLISRVEASADQAKDYLVAGQRRAKQLMHQAEMNTKKYPFRALGIAALVGFLVGSFRKMI